MPSENEKEGRMTNREVAVLMHKLGNAASEGGYVPGATYEVVGRAFGWLGMVDSREDPAEGFAKGFHSIHPRIAQEELVQAPAPDMEELARLLGEMKQHISAQEEGQGDLRVGDALWRMRDTLDKIAAIVLPKE